MRNRAGVAEVALGALLLLLVAGCDPDTPERPPVPPPQIGAGA